MSKYHINPKTGNPGACNAEIRCPFGGEEQHYASREEAREAYELQQTASKPLSSRDLAKKLYEADPDWYWARGNVQVFIPFEKLTAARSAALIDAVKSFSSFVNTFERDLPLSMIASLVKQTSVNKISIDPAS